MYIFRNWSRLDDLNFFGVRANPLFLHDVAQVLNLFLSEARLCLTNVELLTFKHFENKPHMHLMLSFTFRENQDVINVDNNKLPDVRMQNRIYHRLNLSSWSVCQTLNQHFKLKMTKGCTERRLRPTLFINQNLTITRSQIQRGEVRTFRHCV
jgi:hypothetical protein